MYASVARVPHLSVHRGSRYPVTVRSMDAIKSLHKAADQGNLAAVSELLKDPAIVDEIDEDDKDQRGQIKGKQC